MSKAGPVVLVVLDGWGYRAEKAGNAIELGRTPVWHQIWDKNPRTLLSASGRSVGLPEGQMGNSEVGHLNLGAGRVVPQDLVRISDSIANGTFYQLPALVNLCKLVRERGTTLHLVGLLGNGGVHGLDRHLEAAIELGVRHGVANIAIHGFLDGRDTPPKSAAGFMADLVRAAKRLGNRSTRVFVASATGRYFVMDRDHRWDRTRLGYDAMVKGIGRPVDDPVQGVLDAYDRGETDEFIKPMV